MAFTPELAAILAEIEAVRSGNTTLLRIIAGLESPDLSPNGAMLLDNHDVADTSVDQRHVGFVFRHNDSKSLSGSP